MQKCERCRGKEAFFVCMECELFRYLCEECDNYIHSLPGKKLHNRIAVSAERDGNYNYNEFSNYNLNNKQSFKKLN